MKKLICTRGIPASGKSTWAREQKGANILNKDTIRDILHDGVWSKENEKEVVRHERMEVEACMDVGEELIIVDNTHLWVNNPHISFYKDLAEKYNYEFEIKDFFITREEAIKRDAERENGVGVDVINKMIKIQGNGGYPANPIFNCEIKDKLNAYIFDIDWTLAFMDDKRSPYDWSKAEWDRCNIFLREILLKLYEDNHIIICSWRSDEFQAETINWLNKNKIPYTDIFMREEWDTRKDAIVKKEMFDKYIKNKYNVIWVFDDRNQVVDMWRLVLWLPTYQVWYGNF